MFGIEYCESCKEDFHRMKLGYNPHNEDCGRWQCHLLDILTFIGGFLILIPLLIILIPVFIYVFILNLIEGRYHAVQKQGNETPVYAGLGRKKFREPGVGKHVVARRKQRPKKRIRPKFLG